MNTTLSAPSRHVHPPHDTVVHTLPARRVGLLDRLALRLGLALITWGRRPVRRSSPSREQLILLHVQDRARSERERAAERALRTSIAQR